jgi:hypothetical protein
MVGSKYHVPAPIASTSSVHHGPYTTRSVSGEILPCSAGTALVQHVKSIGQSHTAEALAEATQSLDHGWQQVPRTSPHCFDQFCPPRPVHNTVCERRESVFCLVLQGLPSYSMSRVSDNPTPQRLWQRQHNPSIASTSSVHHGPYTTRSVSGENQYLLQAESSVMPTCCQPSKDMWADILPCSAGTALVQHVKSIGQSHTQPPLLRPVLSTTARTQHGL